MFVEAVIVSEELQVIQSMARKRIADQEPAISNEGAAAAPAKAAGKNQPAAPNKARAPRSSATAVTHRHKKNATPENEPASTPAEPAVSPTGLPPAALPARVAAPIRVAPPTRKDIAIRAYLLAEARGFQNGSTEEDWLNAERQLLAERARQ